MFAPAKNKNNANNVGLVEQARRDRYLREDQRVKIESATLIQRWYRGQRSRLAFRESLRQHAAIILKSDETGKDVVDLPRCEDICRAVNEILFKFDHKRDRKLFEHLCRVLLGSIEVADTKVNYMSLLVKKQYAASVILQLERLLLLCARYLLDLNPDSPPDSRFASLVLTLFVTLTTPSKWAFMRIMKNSDAFRSSMLNIVKRCYTNLMEHGLYQCLQKFLLRGLRNKPVISMVVLNAILNISLHPLLQTNFTNDTLALFILHILSIPGLVHHANSISNDAFLLFLQEKVASKVIDFLRHSEQHQKIVFNGLEGGYALCFLGNLVQLSLCEVEVLANDSISFCYVISVLLDRLQRYVEAKQSTSSHWHPILGWFSHPIDKNLQESNPAVTSQLQFLWNPRMVKILFADLFDYEIYALKAPDEARIHSKKKSTFRLPTKSSNNHTVSKELKSLSLSETRPSSLRQSTENACLLYYSAFKTLTQMRSDLLSALSFGDLLRRLWRLIMCNGNSTDWALLLTSSSVNSLWEELPSALHLLTIFCESATSLLVVLDDVELFEQTKSFTEIELVWMTIFLNRLVVTCIWNHSMPPDKASAFKPFNAALKLLSVLYTRNTRHSFIEPSSWLIPNLKISHFIGELAKDKLSALYLLRTVPHILPLKDRIMLFRSYVWKEKSSLGLLPTDDGHHGPSTLIVVHRSQLVEDGYRQLAALPLPKLKGTIRVRFVNDLGLDEAGIDQDGVFKEFLEEILRRVFDPGLNLFRTTEDQCLYPSPLSSLQENHLMLFEFVGRMLGKAVYEGIVVDLNFAPFFLTQLLDRQRTSFYSFMDELASLDRMLYKNLTFIKHYDGDLSDLELTFSYDEDVLGQIVTHDLVPGGRALSLTNENRIGYVHLMANFKMHVQLRQQTQAFIRGFRSVIDAEWLRMFSAPELQSLISGEIGGIDLEDLKGNVRYYGGFHSGHRVIHWLWEVLEKDFTVKERSLFLKFVTSCSRPPLLGFAHLCPPLSIRCVEVSEDNDTGDTLGTVLKGFFRIRTAGGRDAQRLPTSSTCFNLLKLPNYAKKVTLREKLRYAISCNAGFELS